METKLQYKLCMIFTAILRTIWFIPATFPAHWAHAWPAYGLIMSRPAVNRSNMPLYAYLAYCLPPSSCGQLTEIMLTEIFANISHWPRPAPTSTHTAHTESAVKSAAQQFVKQTNTVCICVAARANRTDERLAGEAVAAGAGETLGLLY